MNGRLVVPRRTGSREALPQAGLLPAALEPAA
jgi:hypothetical protein